MTKGFFLYFHLAQEAYLILSIGQYKTMEVYV